MVALAVSYLLYKLDMRYICRKYGVDRRMVYNHFRWFAMYFCFVCISMLVLVRPSTTVNDRQYNLIEKDDSYINFSLYKNGFPFFLGVDTYVLADANGKEKIIKLENYEHVKSDNETPRITYKEVKYEKFSYIEKVLFFPSGISNKDYITDVLVVTPR